MVGRLFGCNWGGYLVVDDSELAGKGASGVDRQRPGGDVSVEDSFFANVQAPITNERAMGGALDCDIHCCNVVDKGDLAALMDDKAAR